MAIGEANMFPPFLDRVEGTNLPRPIRGAPSKPLAQPKIATNSDIGMGCGFLLSLAKLTRPAIRLTPLDEHIRGPYSIPVDNPSEELAFRKSPISPKRPIDSLRDDNSQDKNNVVARLLVSSYSSRPSLSSL